VIDQVQQFKQAEEEETSPAKRFRRRIDLPVLPKTKAEFLEKINRANHRLESPDPRLSLLSPRVVHTESLSLPSTPRKFRCQLYLS